MEEKAEFTKEELQNCEGLNYLTWDMFDSPDAKGSGYRFMEREPVLILDEITKKTRWIFNVTLGYVSEKIAREMSLTTKDAHRVGKAVRVRVTNPYKRMVLIKYLVLYGVEHIAVDRETVYYDTDELTKPFFRLW